MIRNVMNSYEKTIKTAFQNSRIDFYFVTLFYCLYNICILSSGGLRPPQQANEHNNYVNQT